MFKMAQISGENVEDSDEISIMRGKLWDLYESSEACTNKEAMTTSFGRRGENDNISEMGDNFAFASGNSNNQKSLGLMFSPLSISRDVR